MRRNSSFLYMFLYLLIAYLPEKKVKICKTNNFHESENYGFVFLKILKQQRM